MAFLGAERLTVDGVDIKTLAKNVTTIAGMLKSPGRRGANAFTAGRSGARWSGPKPHDVSTYTLPMWVLGCDDDGRIPSGSTARREFFGRVDELTSLFGKDGLLDVKHHLPDGTTRQAFCEVLQVVDFTTSGANPIGKFTVQLVNNDVYFQDLLDFVASSAADVVGQTLRATAPCEDAVYTITGPISNPRITCNYTGAYFEYIAEMGNGEVLVVDSSSWSLFGGGGLVPFYEAVRFEGTFGRFMRLGTPPGLGGGYSVTLSGEFTSPATNLRVTGRCKYLVG